MLRSAGFIGLVAIWAIYPTALRAQARMERLTDLAGNIGQELSADGSTVAGYIFGSSGFSGAYWTPTGGQQTLPAYPGSNRSFVTSVSADGSVLSGMTRMGTSGSYTSTYWLWTASGGYQTIQTGAAYNLGGALSPDGTTWFHNNTRWTAASGLQTVTGITGSVRAVSANGSVLLDSAGGILKNGTVYVTLGAPGLTASGNWTTASALGLSADGTTVVGLVENGQTVASGLYRSQAFRWTEAGGFELLGFYNNAAETDALATSANGSIILCDYGSASTGSYYGLIWDAQHGFRTAEALLTGAGLDLTGWTDLKFRDISDDGSVVYGLGTYNGTAAGFYVSGLSVTAVPEPAAWTALAGAVALGLALHRRRTGA